MFENKLIEYYNVHINLMKMFFAKNKIVIVKRYGHVPVFISKYDKKFIKIDDFDLINSSNVNNIFFYIKEGYFDFFVRLYKKCRYFPIDIDVNFVDEKILNHMLYDIFVVFDKKFDNVFIVDNSNQIHKRFTILVDLGRQKILKTIENKIKTHFFKAIKKYEDHIIYAKKAVPRKIAINFNVDKFRIPYSINYETLMPAKPLKF